MIWKLAVAGSLLLLGACATPPEQLQAEDAALCQGWGAQPGTELYVQCMMLQAQVRAYRAQLASDRLQAAGRSFQRAGAALQGGNPSFDCMTFQLGNGISQTNCR